MTITIPKQSLIILIGPSGSGKTTFANRFFQPHEILSSDQCRKMIANDESNQSANADAFQLLFTILDMRLKNRLLTVVDATNVEKQARANLLAIAQKHHIEPIAWVFTVPKAQCHQWNQQRKDRQVPPYVIERQHQLLLKSLLALEREPYPQIITFRTPEDLNQVEAVVRQPMFFDQLNESGPFDIIGDIHGCYDELHILLQKLGYQFEKATPKPPHYGMRVTHPKGRKVIFVGDLVDRGPQTPEVLKLAMTMVNEAMAFVVMGNHDYKLHRALTNPCIKASKGLQISLDQLAKETPAFRDAAISFLRNLPSHYLFDRGRLVVAHAGIPENMQGRHSKAVTEFCLFGKTTGQKDAYGLPIRLDWSLDYHGKAMVVHGHVVVKEAIWKNRTLDVDTGCVFGGKLTALRYPEMDLVEVPAQKTYYRSPKPLFG